MSEQFCLRIRAPGRLEIFEKKRPSDDFDSLNSSESDNTSIHSLEFEEESFSNELVESQQVDGPFFI